MLGWDDEFCEQLAGSGFHVIRFDNRDIGLSTHLHDRGTPELLALLAGRPAPPPPYSLLEMAEDTVGLLDALGICSAHVVGASMGGMIAQQVAISHPSRVRTLTSIMSTPSRDVGRSQPSALQTILLPPPTDQASAVERMLTVYRVIGSPGYPLDEERLASVARESFDRGYDPAGVARQFAAIVVSPDRAPGLRAVTAPTLVIHGADDPLVEVDGGVATAEAVPGSRLVVIPGMGHNLPSELWPQVIGEIVTHVRKAEAAG
jgi:pimeloyl-ACP methyl ester carboxylesterase